MLASLPQKGVAANNDPDGSATFCSQLSTKLTAASNQPNGGTAVNLKAHVNKDEKCSFLLQTDANEMTAPGFSLVTMSTSVKVQI